MPGVLAARIAKLPGLHPVGMLLLILGGRVVAVLAIPALQRDDFPHDISVLFLSSKTHRPCPPNEKINRQNIFPAD
jgi:hypothetical protein